MMETQIQANSSTNELALELRQQTVLTVLRSHACVLRENEAPREEILAAISPELARDIDIALAEMRRVSVSVVGAADEQQDAVLKEIYAFLSLTAGSWTEENQIKFAEQAFFDLSRFPVALVHSALQEARLRVKWANELVSWIFDYIERDCNRLSSEMGKIQQLKELIVRRV